MPDGQRRWIFVLNNFTEEEAIKLELIPHFYNVVYLICGHEHTQPGDGTPHLQGFIHFLDQRSKPWLRKHIFNRAHWEEARGTDDQQIYSAKEPNAYTFVYGKPAGKHHTAVTMNEYALMSDEDALELCPGRDMQWRSRKEQWKSMRYKPYSGPRQVIWLHGPSGTGKTEFAHRYGDLSAPDFANGFFNGASATTTLLIDEADKVGLPLQAFLRISDRYPTTLNVKGGCIPHTADTVIFTSTCTPEVVWAGSDDYLTQVERRITQCIYTGNPDWNTDLVFID